MTLLISYKETGHNEIELKTNETLRFEYRMSCNHNNIQYDKYLLTIEIMLCHV
jgi:hypothetical protein